MTPPNTETAIAKILLERGAVTLQPDEPFTYSSGIISPIYTDNRVLISYPEDRKKISGALERLARENFGRVDALAGTATAGITWTAWLGAGMNLPIVYVRGRAKRHGQKNQIEGVLKPGSKTVVVDDLISTGQSALGSVGAVRRAGSEPLGVVAIFTYQMESAVTGFKKAVVPLYALTNFRTLVDVAERQGQLTAESRDRVLEWALEPTGWGKKMGFSKEAKKG